MTRSQMSRSTALGRRAGSVLLWGAIFFLAGQLALFALMEFRWPEWRDPEYGLKLARLQNHLVERPSPRPLVLALGSSHTGMGLRPDLVNEILHARPDLPGQPLLFNFAVNSGGPLLQLLYLRRLLRAGIRPDLVLVEVWPISLKVDGEDAIDWDREYYLRRLQLEDVNLVARQTRCPICFWCQWLARQLALCYSQRSFLLGVSARNFLPYDTPLTARWDGLDAWGFQHVAGYESHDQERYQRSLQVSRKAFAWYCSTFQISPTAESSLRRLLQICRQQRIQVLLVRTPESPSVRGWLTSRVEQDMNGLLGRLSRDYYPTIIDARDWIAEEGFGDTEHLAVNGASQFSRRLASEVLVPILKAWRP